MSVRGPRCWSAIVLPSRLHGSGNLMLIQATELAFHHLVGLTFVLLVSTSVLYSAACIFSHAETNPVVYPTHLMVIGDKEAGTYEVNTHLCLIAAITPSNITLSASFYSQFTITFLLH
jgi:hypothetical protein